MPKRLSLVERLDTMTADDKRQWRTMVEARARIIIGQLERGELTGAYDYEGANISYISDEVLAEMRVPYLQQCVHVLRVEYAPQQIREIEALFRQTNTLELTMALYTAIGQHPAALVREILNHEGLGHHPKRQNMDRSVVKAAFELARRYLHDTPATRAIPLDQAAELLRNLTNIDYHYDEGKQCLTLEVDCDTAFVYENLKRK